MVMNKQFHFRLSGGSFFPIFVAFYIPAAALTVLASAWSYRAAFNGTAPSVWPSLAAAVVTILLYLVFAIPFLRILVPALTLDGSPFSFRGSVGRFVGMNLLGLLLSIITIGIYTPWYIARITRYLAAEAGWKDKRMEFTGRGGRPFVILLLTVILPAIVIAAALGIVFYAVLTVGGASPMGSTATAQLVTYLLVLIIFPSYSYELYRWYLTNLRIGDYGIRWNTRFWRSVGFIYLQLLLTIVTLSIYWPAAWIRGYRYFATRSDVTRQQGVYGSVRFTGTPAGGFGLLWGQTLLSIITLGIYLPWAIARIGGWVASNTKLETSEGAG